MALVVLAVLQRVDHGVSVVVLISKRDSGVRGMKWGRNEIWDINWSMLDQLIHLWLAEIDAINNHKDWGVWRQ